ncbi:hypothetical protein GCM10009530_51230 [Microbispora corallina]|uniref:Uncharacterized protein n=1 Tax=Microbispora corallina TaxID=83302 RepID=A0ABQ4G6L5_9ACTN|nr:hypothetical protein [Microbispora corallina]GIH42716.1 hypothetical protein Mco01_57160 [Microbispora corallina]
MSTHIRETGGSQGRGTRVLVVTLGVAVLAIGGVAAAKAGPGGPGAGNPPPSATPSATPSGPVVQPTEAPPTPEPDPSETASPPPLGPIPTITSRDPIAMPLDPVMTSLSDINLLDNAAELKARDCMRSLGFTTWTAGAIPGPADDKENDVLDYLPPADAGQTGYPSIFSDLSGETNVGAASALSQDAVRAYIGAEAQTAGGAAVPDGGCEAEGDRQVKGGTTQLPVDPRFLAGQAKFSALRDDRMQQVFAAWSACMDRKGLHYDDPLSAQTDPRWGERPSGTPAGAEEKATAAADAGCQAETNLVGTYKALEIAYQKQFLAENQADLTTALTTFKSWVSHARSIIAVN